MGILNVTTDSFSDGGCHASLDVALRRADQMLEEGADILDIGGESTRPGATPVPLDQELERVVPLVRALRDRNMPLSVDTYKPQVMRAVLDAGADLINDVWGFRQDGAIEVVRDSHCGLCVMHMQPMQHTSYEDVVGEVRGFLQLRADALVSAGIRPKRICVDPGFGFGKAVIEGNYAMLAHLSDTSPQVSSCLGVDIGVDAGVDAGAETKPFPILAGMSRKSMLGAVTGRPVNERMAASIAAAVCAAQQGAAILRVHDVAPTVDALKIWAAMHEAARQRDSKAARQCGASSSLKK